MEAWNHHNCDHREWMLLPTPGRIPFASTQECFAVCEECGANGTVHYDEGAIDQLIDSMNKKIQLLEDKLAVRRSV